MKKLLPPLLLTLFTMAPLQSHWYVGLGFNHNGLFPGEGPGINRSDHDLTSSSGGHFLLGYALSPVFAIETGYIYLGHMPIPEIVKTMDIEIDWCFRDLDWVIPLRSKFSCFLSKHFALCLFLGLNYFNRTECPPIVTLRPETRDGLSLTGGFGAEWFCTQQLSLRAAVNQYGTSANMSQFRTAVELTALWGF